SFSTIRWPLSAKICYFQHFVIFLRFLVLLTRNASVYDLDRFQSHFDHILITCSHYRLWGSALRHWSPRSQTWIFSPAHLNIAPHMCVVFGSSPNRTHTPPPATLAPRFRRHII